jgi:hypothetical protein
MDISKIEAPLMNSQKSENMPFGHSRENGNPIFSIRLQPLDSRLRGNDAFLRNHQLLIEGIQ